MLLFCSTLLCIICQYSDNWHFVHENECKSHMCNPVWLLMQQQYILYFLWLSPVTCLFKKIHISIGLQKQLYET